MLTIPKTPKNKSVRHVCKNNFSVGKGTLMPKSKLFIAANTLKEQTGYEKLLAPLPSTPQKFIPSITSTPCAESFKKQEEVLEEPEIQTPPIEVIQLDSDDESFVLPPLPPVKLNSPEPRPVSEPFFSRLPTTTEPRPVSAEPVPARNQKRRSPLRRLQVTKLTIAMTPHCARPTKSWLNRMACFKRSD